MDRSDVRMTHCATHDIAFPDEDCCPWCLAAYTADAELDGCYYCGSPLHHSSDCREA